uniref:Uncharacterized protein n=1 Tax=Palpitomonas bilix TaxID=652834 RepID=A0A7S3CYX6_9EUKA|mmetsp:Transcript_15250/g.38482  ORF Transcript_15250/g.38482 Transcript_15250/m.38482 type:complete len:197 (+) Transcript_15250:99-689(+)
MGACVSLYARQHLSENKNEREEDGGADMREEAQTQSLSAVIPVPASGKKEWAKLSALDALSNIEALSSIANDSRIPKRTKTLLFVWCSWCFKRTCHRRMTFNLFQRSVYSCLGCLRRTLVCRNCRRAMTRGHRYWDDWLCAKCEGLISKWSDSLVLTANFRYAWCSWCFNQTRHELIEQRETGRDIYQCEPCGEGQ